MNMDSQWSKQEACFACATQAVFCQEILSRGQINDPCPQSIMGQGPVPYKQGTNDENTRNKYKCLGTMSH